MTTTSSLATLVKSNLRSWISAKGFWLVAAAAILPLVLTAAWVGTHRADISVTELRVPDDVQDGANTTLLAIVENRGRTHIDAVNVTLGIVSVSALGQSELASRTATVEDLAPGQTREVELNWTATGGLRYFVVDADPRDELGERDEFDNYDFQAFAARFGEPAADAGPRPVANLSGADGAPAADLVVALEGVTAEPSQGANQTYTLRVTNSGAEAVTGALAHLRVAAKREGGTAFFTVTNTSRTLTLDAGASDTITLPWTATTGLSWVEGWVVPPTDRSDPDSASNHATQAVRVQPTTEGALEPEEPEARLTIKQFYYNTLLLLYLGLVLPLIALYYAGGVLSDERDRGSLPYLLTRPVPRWTIPLTRFVAGLVVGTLAAALGLALTYALLFGATNEGGDVGFLVTPLLISIIALAVYGAFFLFLGVRSAKPYIVGLLLVLGWETVAGRIQLQTASGTRPLADFLVPWASNLTIIQHINNAFSGWPLDEGLVFFPEGENARRALLVLLGILVVSLAAAAYTMRRREFEVG